MLAQALLAWYDRHRRDLPWRGHTDPYRIWVSEIMLQQTRVEAVVRHYARFLERFPSVEALAAAELESVLAAWSGLGYYRRARQLHAAARWIVAAGEFPRTPQELERLPGIGAYTAAAVASMAFGIEVAVLDGNVERVMSRLLALEGDPRSAKVRRRLLAAAADLLDPARPGDSNQALMEVGATICSPRRPRCPLCPLGAECQAAMAGSPEGFPSRRPRRATLSIRGVVGLVERSGRLLLFRRPDDSALLAGTWELPWVDLTSEDRPPSEALGLRYGGLWKVGERVASVRHSLTYRLLNLEVRRCEIGPVEAVGEGLEAGFFSESERAALPLSSLVTKVLAGASAVFSCAEGESRPRIRRRGCTSR